MSIDKFTEGYETCFAFTEEKGFNILLIQQSDYVEASAAKEMTEAKSGDLGIDMEDLTYDGDIKRKRVILSTTKFM